MVLSDEIAVMSEGRVLQTAPPEMLYARPASRTVAAFFGAPNLVPAKTREVRRSGESALARVEGDGWEGWCTGPATLQPGESVTVVVRPEAVRLGRAARHDAGIVWRGVVRQRVFRGTRTLYAVEVGGARFTVDAPPDSPLAPGAEVTLDVDAAHTWIVRD